MLKKSLIFRYVFVSLFVAVCAIFGINIYKNFLIHSEEALSMQHIQLAYNDAMQENKQIAELIFFNNLLHDSTIQTLYKQAIQKGMIQNSKEQLHDYLKDKFYYFKSFGIKSINFYLPNNTLLLNMSNQNFKGTSKRESITYVNSTNKEIQTVEVTENSASSVYIKPFFDKELNHIGAIEIEFSFDYIAQRIEKNTHYSLFFMHQNSVLEKSLFEEYVQTFMAFDLNSKYKLHNSVYTELNYKSAVFEQFSNESKNVILKNMDKLKAFALHVFLDTQYQMVVFIPLFNALTNEHNTYLMAIGNAEYSEISKIYHSLNYVILLAFFILLIMFMLIFNVQSFKEKHATILKEYNDLFKAIDKYVIMAQTDREGFITYITQAFCDISGYTKKEIIGRNINIIRHPDMSKKFFENMWNSLYKEKRWEGEIKNIDKNGNSYWVKGIIFPKYDINNNLVGYTSIRVNISDTKQLKKINNLLKEDLSNKLYEIKMRDDSLADTTKIVLMGKILDSLAHQWKKPLSSISIELANLKARITANELTSNEVENIHDEIAYQIKTLSMTLNEFKTFFSNSNLHDKYNVYSAINESILLIKPECELHHITIFLDSKQEIYCYGIFNELKQIIINLLKNSIEHLINNKTQEPLINITVFEEQKSVMIVYTDNTKGESKNIIEKVFSNNYEEQTLKDVGLNLYIAKLLLEKSGAQFWFENEQGLTSFYIKLVSHDRRKDQRA
jgi:PAS domain S-box-containing protein